MEHSKDQQSILESVALVIVLCCLECCSGWLPRLVVAAEGAADGTRVSSNDEFAVLRAAHHALLPREIGYCRLAVRLESEGNAVQDCYASLHRPEVVELWDRILYLFQLKQRRAALVPEGPTVVAVSADCPPAVTANDCYAW